MIRALGFLAGFLPAIAFAQGFSAAPTPSILSAVVSSSNLILNMSDGSALNAGAVVGPPGANGTNGAAGPVNTANVLAYQVSSSPASGSTVAMTAGKSVLYVNNPALLGALTVTLPPSPADGQFVRITEASGITLLTIKDSTGATTLASIASLGTLGTSLWQYQSTAWVRLQ